MEVYKKSKRKGRGRTGRTGEHEKKERKRKDSQAEMGRGQELDGCSLFENEPK